LPDLMTNLYHILGEYNDVTFDQQNNLYAIEVSNGQEDVVKFKILEPSCGKVKSQLPLLLRPCKGMFFISFL
jgi:hypothetical protein